MTAKPEMDHLPEPGDLTWTFILDKLNTMHKRLNVLEARVQDAALRAEIYKPWHTPDAYTLRTNKLPASEVSLCFNGIEQESWIAAHRIMCELTGMEDPKAAMENIEARMKLGADVRKKVEALDTIKSLWFRPSPPETEWRVIDENSAFAIQAALKKAYGAP